MKKIYGRYFAAWIVMLLGFNAFAVYVTLAKNFSDAPASFWIGFGLVDVSLVGQLLCTTLAFRADSLRRLFYNISMVRISYMALVLSFLLGGVFMVLLPVHYWTCGIICVLLLVAEAVAVLKASAAAEVIEDVDLRTQQQTLLVKKLTAQALELKSNAAENLRGDCVRVYEALRYSDPVSTEALAGVEKRLSEHFTCFAVAVRRGEEQEAHMQAQLVLALTVERGQLCKLGK